MSLQHTRLVVFAVNPSVHFRNFRCLFSRGSIAILVRKSVKSVSVAINFRKFVSYSQNWQPYVNTGTIRASKCLNSDFGLRLYTYNTILLRQK